MNSAVSLRMYNSEQADWFMVMTELPITSKAITARD